MTRVLALLLLATAAAAQTITIPEILIPARQVELPAAPQPVPITAELLSAPGALQAYVESELKRVGRVGPILLPRGDIGTQAEPVTLDLTHLVGVVMQGTGAAIKPQGFNSAWNRWSVNHGTRITGHVTITSCHRIVLADLTLSSPDDEPALRIQTDGWGGCNDIRLVGVVTAGSERGWEIGGGSSPNNSADMHFADCAWEDCGVAFKTLDPQNVCYNFDDCDWRRTDVAAWFVNGGNAVIDGGSSNGLRECYRITNGGGNCATFTIRDHRFDVTGNARPTVLCNAELPRGGACRFRADAVQVVRKSGYDGPEVPLIRVGNPASFKAEITGGLIPSYCTWDYSEKQGE